MNRSLAIVPVAAADASPSRSRKLSCRSPLIVPWKALESTEARRPTLLDAHDPKPTSPDGLAGCDVA